MVKCFNPQARESLITTSKTSSGCAYGFNPQARESLIPSNQNTYLAEERFNPQARESLIVMKGNPYRELIVSIRRLARA